MRSAYLLAINFLGNDSFSGSWIWKLPSLLRIQMFIWKCIQQSIGVKECLANRGIPLETTCPLCHLEAEYIMHALRGCSLVKSIWHQLGTHYLYSTLFSQDIREWITTNGGLKSSQNAVGIPQNVIFSFALQLIQKQRNQVVFTNRGVNQNLGKIITLQASEFFLCASQPKCNNQMVLRQVTWEKSEQGWLKLNTNGSWDTALGKAAEGGLIRDGLGNWVVGFTRKLGSANSFIAEVQALCDGLMLCHQLKLPAIIVELDAKALVDALSNPG